MPPMHFVLLSSSAMQTVDAKTAAGWLKAGEAVLVDVRSPAEYAGEHIKGAHNVPVEGCCASALPPHEGKKLVIQCHSGGRSARACAALSLPYAYNLEGGIMAWKDAGLPIARRVNILPLMQQVQVAVGALVVLFTMLGALVSPWFLLGAGAVGLGLVNAGLTGWCGMAKLLGMMPWNRV
jgi:rhodanese-related sulfurtransferase